MNVRVTVYVGVYCFRSTYFMGLREEKEVVRRVVRKTNVNIGLSDCVTDYV